MRALLVLLPLLLLCADVRAQAPSMGAVRLPGEQLVGTLAVGVEAPLGGRLFTFRPDAERIGGVVTGTYTVARSADGEVLALADGPAQAAEGDLLWLELDGPPSLLELTASPEATVLWDGIDLGRTPLQLSVVAGAYPFTFQAEDHAPETFTVTVGEGQITARGVALRPTMTAAALVTRGETQFRQGAYAEALDDLQSARRADLAPAAAVTERLDRLLRVIPVALAVEARALAAGVPAATIREAMSYVEGADRDWALGSPARAQSAFREALARLPDDPDIQRYADRYGL